MWSVAFVRATSCTYEVPSPDEMAAFPPKIVTTRGRRPDRCWTDRSSSRLTAEIWDDGRLPLWEPGLVSKETARCTTSPTW